MRRSVLVLLLPILLTSCSSDGKNPGSSPSPTRSCPLDGPSIPAECVETGPTPSATVFPSDASKIAPVTLQPVAGRLGGADNRDDPSRRTATFTLTVPKGARIGSDAGCLGNGSITVETVPASKAFQTITCNADAELFSELLAEDPTVLAKATTFMVTVTADAASRWDVAIYATTAKVG